MSDQFAHRASDFLVRAPRDDDEAETVTYVGELAIAWKRGELPLEQIPHMCSGRDRSRATACLPLGSPEKLALLDLLDALIAADDRSVLTQYGVMRAVDVEAPGTLHTRDWDGKRVTVWPVHYIAGEPVYPRFDLPPGANRQEAQENQDAEYREYRKSKRGRRHHEDE
jgi:hypothetical protein